MDIANDKLSLKNLLFTKAIPNHEIPIPISGHKVYACIDCGDKFLFETSYEDHINRKSMQITYMCRYCGQTKIFYNRCKLLFHIRSHSFKTATINVNDLKVEPLPISLYKIQSLPVASTAASTSQVDTYRKGINNSNFQTTCNECKTLLPVVGGGPHKDRVAHLMSCNTSEVFACPVCTFTLPTMCALRAHMRFHLKYPPYFCPECGLSLNNKNVHYPFNHDCSGFKMMSASARLKCALPECPLVHPNDFKDHMRENHIKMVYKCPYCVVACFNEETMQKHLSKGHSLKTDAKALIFYQCKLCPGRLVLQFHIDTHLRTHMNANVFPCCKCDAVFKEVFALIDHHVKKHVHPNPAIEEMLTTLVHESENQQGKPKRIYRVVKRCDQCNRNFTYKCKYSDISILPVECPYKCTSKFTSDVSPDEGEPQLITCHMCKTKISCDWAQIKKHYAEVHKNHRCLEPKLIVKRMNVLKYIKGKKYGEKKKTAKRIKRRNTAVKKKETEAQETFVRPPTAEASSGRRCGICGEQCQTKENLEDHFKSHSNPCMAYQCMECGQSFVVKPSFSKHLLLEHGISNTEEYINSKQCYNENAHEKCHNSNDFPIEPLRENQCNICRDQFDNNEDLTKHFRVHGMAFLLKSTLNKSP